MLLIALITLVILAIWCWACLMARSYGLLGRRIQALETTSSASTMSESDEATLSVPLSVVIAAHNQAEALQRNLPAILNQAYPNFEVVVVDMSSTDDTLTVLERMELQNRHLRHTYTPKGSRDISVERLALTLGIRSAQHEWIILTHADCHPLSPHWLETIASYTRSASTTKKGAGATTAPQLLLGHSLYDPSLKGMNAQRRWKSYKVGFYRLWKEIGFMNHVLRRHAAVSADSCNLAFKKSAFLEAGGFAAGQHLLMGAEELLVNSLSTRHNTQVMLNPESFVVQEFPLHPTEQWEEQRLFYTETRRHQHRTKIYRLRQTWMMLAPWAVILFVGLPFIALAIVTTLLLTRQMDASLCMEAWERCTYVLSINHWPWHISASDIKAFMQPTAEQQALLTHPASIRSMDEALLFAKGLARAACIPLTMGLTTLSLLALLFNYLHLKLSSFNLTAKAFAYRGFYTTLLLFELQLPFWALTSQLRHLLAPKNKFRKKFV